MFPPVLLQAPGSAELIIILMVLLVSLVAFVVWAGICYWVYLDAQKRGEESPPLWAAVVFFAGIIGLIFYVIFRD